MSTKRFRDDPRERYTRKDDGLRRWHRRRVTQIGGSFAVILPKSLVTYDRKASAQKLKWTKGAEVEIALGYGGRLGYDGVFIVRAVPPKDDELGFVYGDDLPDMSSYEPVRKRRK